MVVAVTGFWIGILRMRLRQRYLDGGITPYRGWKAWHHIAGLTGGVFVLTWIFSGWLSLGPGEFFSERGVDRAMALRYGGNDAPLIDDDAHTWFHLDPVTGDILGRIDDSRRTCRWLFNALHSFDFALLLRYRPAWDAVVWLLSLLGLIVSVSGIVIGWRRLRH